VVHRPIQTERFDLYRIALQELIRTGWFILLLQPKGAGGERPIRSGRYALTWKMPESHRSGPEKVEMKAGSRLALFAWRRGRSHFNDLIRGAMTFRGERSRFFIVVPAAIRLTTSRRRR